MEKLIKKALTDKEARSKEALKTIAAANASENMSPWQA